MACLTKNKIRDYLKFGRKMSQGDRVVAHLRGCNSCQTKISAMRDAEVLKNIENIFNRIKQEGRLVEDDGSPCFEIDQLILYLEGGLEGEERDRMERHLAFCSECLEKVVFYQETLVVIDRKVKRMPVDLEKQALKIFEN